MAYDPQEQEQIENLKAFWQRYGGFILTVVTIIALAFAGWRALEWYQTRQAGQAALAYEQLRQAAGTRDTAKVREAAGKIFADYPETAWAQMAALVAADVYVDAGDVNAAKVPLQWAIDEAQDPAYRDEARLRLAGILLDQKAYDEALRLISEASVASYAGLFADRRGDLLVAQGKTGEARSAYEQALQQMPIDNGLRRLVQIKLDALGGGAA
jgi:predicted negative regulator of RcsB-dependent stress response